MQAEIGNKIVVRGRRVGARNRQGVIVGVQGTNGGPPYVVRWDDQPGEHLFFPGTDALIG